MPRPGFGAGGIPEQLAEFLEQVNPNMLEELREMRNRDPNRFRQAIGRAFQQMREMTRLKEEDPAAFEERMRVNEVEREIRDLARTLREGEDNEKKAEAKQRLRTALGEVFDMQMTQREREIEAMQKRLEEYRGILEKRRANKEAIIESRLKDMAGENDGMRWELPPPQAMFQPERRGGRERQR